MPDGSSYRDHVAVAEARGVRTGELDLVPIPSDCDQIYRVFWQLRRSAGGNGFSQNPISYPHIESWQNLWGVRLEPLELDLIEAMDSAALTAFAENARQQQQQSRS